MSPSPAHEPLPTPPTSPHRLPATEYADNSTLDVATPPAVLRQLSNMALDQEEGEQPQRSPSVEPCHVQEVLRNTDSEQSASENDSSESGEDDEEQEQPTITPTPEQLAAARFTSWYKQHQSHTIASRIIPLTAEHVQYLLSDSIHIPSALLKHQYNADEVDEYDEDQSEWQQQHVDERLNNPRTQSLSDSESDDEERSEDEQEFFPELVQAINTAITELGGAVFPRIDLTNPSDAVWITVERTLKCTTAGDVLLLMKASTSVAEELHAQQQAAANTEEQKEAPAATSSPCLILRKYVDIHPSRKFRCFIKDNQLIGISQHDCAQHYEHLTDTQTKRQIRDAITMFFTTHLRHQHPVSDYIFDVYGTEQMRVRLITIKPWSSDVSSLLFTWRELVEHDTRNEYPAELRVVGHHDSNAYHNVSLRHTAQKIMHRLPHMDNIDLSDAEAIERFAEACKLGKLT